ncbi:LssY C-terminal domain-containing protein [Rudaea sp.]|uniref:LssY C-terminal domain-containing protein n=1 Tax=Rudaea sp. TaxID=2136325 RepID=UPI00321F9765
MRELKTNEIPMRSGGVAANAARALLLAIVLSAGPSSPVLAGGHSALEDFFASYLALAAAGTRSSTPKGAPGDPLNLAFVGGEDDLLRLMAKAGWFPADPITLRSSLRITMDSIVRRPYVDAPVSSLYVDGRKQDLAFEQPAANNPSKRHHVRFWRIAAPGPAQWIAAATYDTSIGLARVNGHVSDHVTHHISADVDAERDKLLADLQRTGGVSVNWVDGFQPLREGRNGGGDPFHTDGRLALVVVAAAAVR